MRVAIERSWRRLTLASLADGIMDAAVLVRYEVALRVHGQAARLVELVRRRPPRAELADAMGEICNMVAGNFKNKISGLSDGCMLSVPTVITGSDYNLHSPADSETLELKLLFERMDIDVWEVIDAAAGGIFARGLEIVGRVGGGIDKGLRGKHRMSG